jgi:plasmid stabilization system protein ParE
VPDYVIAPEAQADLVLIDEYIAWDNPVAADHLLDDLYGAMQRAADEPQTAGSIREDLTSRSVRFTLVRRNYWVIYAARSDGTVVIVRVLHVRMDVRSVL